MSIFRRRVPAEAESLIGAIDYMLYRLHEMTPEEQQEFTYRINEAFTAASMTVAEASEALSRVARAMAVNP